MPATLIWPAIFYATYFAGVGLTLPFVPLHFEGLGFSGRRIGFLMAISPLATSFVPLLWGWLADRFGLRRQLLRVATAGVLVMFLVLGQVRSFLACALTLFVLALCNSPVLPLIDSITIAEVRRLGADYGRVRLFGSLGFVLSVSSFGIYSHFVGPVGPGALQISAAILLLAFLSSLGLTGSAEPQNRPGLVELKALLGLRPLAALLGLCAFYWLSMTPYHTFLAVHVDALSMSGAVTGVALGCGGAAEVVLMRVFGRAQRRLPGAHWLVLCFALSAARWMLTAHATHPWFMVAIQVLHAFSFGAFYLTALDLLQEQVPESLRATGQSLFFSVVFGLGGGLGSLASGAIYQELGGVRLFEIAAALALAASLLAAIRPWETRRV